MELPSFRLRTLMIAVALSATIMGVVSSFRFRQYPISAGFVEDSRSRGQVSYHIKDATYSIAILPTVGLFVVVVVALLVARKSNPRLPPD